VFCVVCFFSAFSFWAWGDCTLRDFANSLSKLFLSPQPLEWELKQGTAVLSELCIGTNLTCFCLVHILFQSISTLNDNDGVGMMFAVSWFLLLLILFVLCNIYAGNCDLIFCF